MTGPRLPAGVAEALDAAGGGAGWTVVRGPELLAAGLPPPDRRVVLPRLDPRWSLVDPLHRTVEDLPEGAPVLVPTLLGERLLLRARPSLRPLRAGAYPAPEEVPSLVEGPRPERGPGAGRPLDPRAFPPAPGTGARVLLAPTGVTVPPAVRALEDEAARLSLEIEEAFLRGLGPLPPGAAVGARSLRKVSVLFLLEASLLPADGEPRVLAADIPVADARQFARAFGRHLAG